MDKLAGGNTVVKHVQTMMMVTVAELTLRLSPGGSPSDVLLGPPMLHIELDTRAQST